MLNPSLKVFVAGHRGLVGSAIVRRLQAGGYTNLLLRSHQDLDLTDQSATQKFFEAERPDYVVLAAARVGGIHANATSPGEFIYENLAIETNVIHEAWRTRATGLLFLGSSCIYPKYASQPIAEDALLSGKLEPTNEAYAVAKIAGLKLCAAYNAQYGTDFLSVMPTNLFGPGDNYDPITSHVVPALIRKMHEAKLQGLPQVSIWGTGTPRRELLYSDDLADACVYLMERSSAKEIGEVINIGVGEELTIRDLAGQIAEVVGYGGALTFDTSRPDGTPRKLLDSQRLRKLGWAPKTSLRRGLELTYADFLRNARPGN